MWKLSLRQSAKNKPVNQRMAAALGFGLIVISVVTVQCSSRALQQHERVAPNIVYILTDDLGYGDVSCYNPAGKIRTPFIDRLARQGMRFTDAHAPSSVCTPTRYALLTGEYAWRSRLPQGVLRGYGRSLISPETFTVGAFLQRHGYQTAVIGKWHLGLDWVVKDGHEQAMQPGSYGVRSTGMVSDMEPDHIDFNEPPMGGPLARGFDYSFILPASLDMEPYVYLENDTLLELPSSYTQGSDLNTGYTGAFWRAGKMAPSFEFDQVLDTFTEKAIDYLHQQKEAGQPFFLYLPFAAPHTPWVPTAGYQGKSGAGIYGDFVQMVDAAVGSVLASLDTLGLAENTIVIFSSDNGPFWRPAFAEQFQHRAAGPWKGMKADVWEGGHRIPFIVRWPGRVQEGAVSHASTTLTNLAATCSQILGVPLDAADARDSYGLLPVLEQRSDTVPGQPAIVHHSSMGHFALRQGDWKFIEKRGSGGFSKPTTYTPKPGEPEGELYNLRDDPGESVNLYNDRRDKVEQLREVLNDLRSR